MMNPSQPMSMFQGGLGQGVPQQASVSQNTTPILKINLPIINVKEHCESYKT